jgi:tetratricopeptide (TPR) repeat protein
MKEAVAALSRLAYTFSPTDSRSGIAASERALEMSKGIGDEMLLARSEVLAASFRLLHDGWRNEDAEIFARTMPVIKALSAKDISAPQEILYPAQVQILQGQYRLALDAESRIQGLTSNALIGYLGGWSKSLALAHMGQFGELLVQLRTLKDSSTKNGNMLWFSAISGLEAELRHLAFDFQGARELCNAVLPMCSGKPSRTPRAIILLSAGHAELGLGDHQEAIHCFNEVETMTSEPFYMYWWWRMHAQLGLARASLASGNISNASAHCESFLNSALSTADPNMQLLAWEMKARLSIVQENWKDASKSVQSALAILEKQQVPISTWRVHDVACELYLLQGRNDLAEEQRSQAEAGVRAIADSFPMEEPLRRVFLDAAPIQRILSNRPAAKAGRR